MSIKRWVPALLAASLGSAGCARPQPPPKAAGATGSEARATVERDKAAEPVLREQLVEGDALYTKQLGEPSRDERFGVDRQVAALRKAIALYEQFIERAEGDERFEEAVKRSRERIEDARATIDFLLAGVEKAVSEREAAFPEEGDTAPPAP